MVSRPRHRLAHDHAQLDALLKQLQQALKAGDLEASHTKLDLFWARLAVHIRAEHLHLFPRVLSRLSKLVNQTVGPSPSQAQSIVNDLRADHDFFMHKLAEAIGTLRDMTNSEDVAETLKTIRETVIEVEKRLLVHNEIEEKQVYGWSIGLFDEQEQIELLTLINKELEHYPSRFTFDPWTTGTESKGEEPIVW